MEYNYFDYKKVLTLLKAVERNIKRLQENNHKKFKECDFSFFCRGYEEFDDLILWTDFEKISESLLLVESQIYFNGLSINFEMQENICLVYFETDISDINEVTKFSKGIFNDLSFDVESENDELLREENWRNVLYYFDDKVNKIVNHIIL